MRSCLHQINPSINGFARRNSRILAVLIIGLFVVATALARPSNKWRICFNHRAESYGVITFSVEPVGGEPIEVQVEIEEGWGENTVAKVARNAFRDALPPEIFHIERDDGEDVLVKKRHGAANFELHLMNSSVKNVRIKIKRE